MINRDPKIIKDQHEKERGGTLELRGKELVGLKRESKHTKQKAIID